MRIPFYLPHSLPWNCTVRCDASANGVPILDQSTRDTCRSSRRPLSAVKSCEWMSATVEVTVSTDLGTRYYLFRQFSDKHLCTQKDTSPQTNLIISSPHYGFHHLTQACVDVSEYQVSRLTRPHKEQEYGQKSVTTRKDFHRCRRSC
jgi:hypothetical protein